MDVEQRWTVSWKITRLVLQRSDVALLNGDETLMKEKSQRSTHFMCVLFMHQSSCKLCLANPAPHTGGMFGTHLLPPQLVVVRFTSGCSPWTQLRWHLLNKITWLLAQNQHPDLPAQQKAFPRVCGWFLSGPASFSPCTGGVLPLGGNRAFWLRCAPWLRPA